MTDSWISVKDRQPNGGSIVLMYSESNNEFSVGHFVLSRAEVPVTHWQHLLKPGQALCPFCFEPDCSGHYGNTAVYAVRHG